MAIQAKIANNVTSIKAVVTQSGAVSTQASTLTLKNTVKDEITLRELTNVVESSPNNGDTLVYNAELNKYEVKPIVITANTVVEKLNGGTF